jgi:hypothetical protein
MKHTARIDTLENITVLFNPVFVPFYMYIQCLDRYLVKEAPSLDETLRKSPEIAEI